jgi:hypothetical protein
MRTLTADAVTSVSQLLHAVGQGAGMPTRIRDAARYWAREVTPGMPREDVQTVAWLLQDVGGLRRLPMDRRDAAQYWAAYLDSVR